MTNAFAELGFSPAIVASLQKAEWHKPTEIQKKAIPLVSEGRDLLAIAQTGSGKTGAFLLPILDRIAQTSARRQNPTALILAPTRELALQLMQNVEFFAPALDLSGALLIGGASALMQKEALEARPDIIVATPGRLLDHLRQKNLTLCDIEFLVLDEADRMLDMGFYDDIIKIAKLLPPTCQNIMFSATMPDKIRLLARTILHDPVEVKIAISKPVEAINQKVCHCAESQKTAIIRGLFKENPSLERVIIFVSSKKKVKELASSLKSLNLNVAEMHSDLEQVQREKTMVAFRNNHISVLVATDIISRGIDIDDISMVINYDVPHDEEDYIHRIGRTARAGRGGEALTLVNAKDELSFRNIEKFIGKKLEEYPLPAGMQRINEHPVRVNHGAKGAKKDNAHARSQKKGRNFRKRRGGGKAHGHSDKSTDGQQR